MILFWVQNGIVRVLLEKELEDILPRKYVQGPHLLLCGEEERRAIQGSLGS